MSAFDALLPKTITQIPPATKSGGSAFGALLASPQTQARVSAKAAVAANPDQHVYNPLNTNNKIAEKLPPTGMMANTFSLPALAESVNKIGKVAEKGLGVASTGLGKVFNAVGAGAEAVQKAIQVPGGVLSGQSPKQAYRTAPTIGQSTGEFVKGLLGNTADQAEADLIAKHGNSFVDALIASIPDISRELVDKYVVPGLVTSAIGGEVLNNQKSLTVTPKELQALLDNPKYEWSPEAKANIQLKINEGGFKLGGSVESDNVLRQIAGRVLGGSPKNNLNVERLGFPNNVSEVPQLSNSSIVPKTTPGFPTAISNVTSLTPGLISNVPAAVPGFPTGAPKEITSPITAIQAPAGPIDNTITPNPADAAKQAELQSGFVAGPSQMLDDVRSVIDNFKAGMAKEADAQRLRIKLVGEGNVRIAQANQLIDSLKQIVKDPIQQEVLNLYRNFKDRPQELTQYLNGTHPQIQEAMDYFKLSNPDASPSDLAGFRAEQMGLVKKLSHLIEGALNPSESIKAVDQALTEYSKAVLSEGHQLGILESSINPETYVPQFTQPRKQGFMSKASGGKYGGRFVHGLARTFVDPLHALVNLHEPQSLNAFNNFTVYAERYGHAAATVQFLRNLKEEGLANFDAKTTPENWEAVKFGKNKIVYLPKDIADAVRIIVDPDVKSIPGWLNNALAYQTFIKATEVSLSIFHAKALTLTAMADIGPIQAFKNFGSDQESQAYKDTELDGIKHGLTTSIEGRSIEAKKIINETSLPSRAQALASLPMAKQVIQVSDALTRATFDVVQRNEKVKSYGMKVAGWMANHPNLTETELFDAKTDIARMVNATYGGLNWDGLGVSKVTRLLARAFTFAPDWWWSNILNAKYAFEGGITGNWQDYFSKSPAGKYSRAFWLKAIIGGLLATQLASLAVSHKMKLNRPFSVYLGKDKDGKDLYANWFFVGGPGDFAKWIQNIADQGVIGGTVNTLANKMGSIPRGLMHQATNKNFLGQDIAVKGAPNNYNDLRRLWQWITDTAPIPFTGTDVANLVIAPKKEATFWDYFDIMIGSTTSHKVPEGEYVVPSGHDKGKVKPIPQKTLNRPKKNLWEFLKTGGSIYKPVK